MRVAAANWEIRSIAFEVEFFHHIEEFAENAASQGAELLVLPELMDLEMLQLKPELVGRAQAEWLAGFQTDLLEEAAHLAANHNIALVTGSNFARHGAGIVNRSWMVSQDGRTAFQDKMVMTQFELSDWGIQAGEALNAMPDSRVGIAICYDSEFPPGVLLQAERGVQVVCVPTFTETWHGFHRVRHCCLARATENQLFVVQSSLVGSLGREPVPEAHGSAMIAAPAVVPFPFDGILAESARDREDLIVADLDFDVLMSSREDGDVRNWADRGRGNWRYNQA